MIVDGYLHLLHLDRRLPLNIDLGPVHIHLYSRSVFLLWVTVALLAVTGVAVLVSRKPELIARWRCWMMIAPAFGIPIWLGNGGAAALAAVLGVVAVAEYARMAALGRATPACCSRSRSATRLPPGCGRHCCLWRRSWCWPARCRRSSAVTPSEVEHVPPQQLSGRCGSAGRCRIW